MPEKPQSLQSHTMWDPAFHFFLAPVGLLLLIGSIVRLVQNFDLKHGAYVLIFLWALVAIFKMRVYSLKVQDRVIRLEERLRLEKMLDEPLKSRVGELSVDQLIGLRFCCEAELPGVVQKALAENLNRKQIKQAIQTWRPDYWRV